MTRGITLLNYTTNPVGDRLAISHEARSYSLMDKKIDGLLRRPQGAAGCLLYRTLAWFRIVAIIGQ